MKYIIAGLLICFSTINLFSQSADSIKLAKKNERIQKRYIHPKSRYISVSAGWIFNATHTKDLNNFFDPLTMVNNGFFPNIVYEHGIKNNFFAELGYDLTSQNISLSRDMGDDQSWSLSGNFFANIKPFNRQLSHNLHFGGGYRLIGKNNFHFINFHGGLFLGVSNKSSSDISPFLGTVTYTINEEHTNLNYQIERTLDSYSRFSLGAYLGVSKEFRLSDEIRFFVKYTHRFGFLSTFSGSYVMISDDIDFKHDASFVVRGGGAFITGGLKLLLFKDKLTAYEE